MKIALTLVLLYAVWRLLETMHQVITEIAGYGASSLEILLTMATLFGAGLVVAFLWHVLWGLG